jgi:hypothetical protein
MPSKSSTTKGKSSPATSKDDMTKTTAETRTPHDPPYCPHHNPILGLEVCGVSGHGQTPMGRFLAEPPSEQSSLFYRADTGKLSTWKGCLCGTV